MAYPNIKGRTILIADDEVELVKVLHEDFTNYGAKVLVAHTGLEAVKILAVASVDLVISDVRMPEADGVDVLKFIFSNEGAKEPKMIIMSGFADISAEEFLSFGVQAYFMKPFRLAELLAAADKALDPSRS